MEKTAKTFQDSSSQVSTSSLAVDETEQILERAVIRLNASILGIVLGILTGLGIFIATNFLILKGGAVVGPHLSLLGAFFPYYTVTFGGSILGFIYGFVCGFVAGFIIASIYNLVVRLKSG
jgi:hypothetical protein